MAIHSTAIVDPRARLGNGVEILPFTIIEGDVEIGDNCVIGPHAVIRSYSRIGADCRIAAGAVLGEIPQDRKFAGEVSYLEVGCKNEIREYVTLHRASGEGNSTVIGDENILMAYSHAGHNARVGNHCHLANGVQLSGHCIIEDSVTIGGLVGVHQFVTVGKLAMVGGMSRINRDVAPFCIVEGNPVREHGVNIVGLKRHDIDRIGRAEIRQAYRIAFRSDYGVSEGLAQIRAELGHNAEVAYLCDFLERTSQGSLGRQLCPR